MAAGHFMLGMSQGVQSMLPFALKRQETRRLEQAQKEFSQLQQQIQDSLFNLVGYDHSQEWLNNIYPTLPREQQDLFWVGMHSFLAPLGEATSKGMEAIRTGNLKELENHLSIMRNAYERAHAMEELGMSVEVFKDEAGMHRVRLSEADTNFLRAKEAAGAAGSPAAKDAGANRLLEMAGLEQLHVPPDLGPLGQKFQALESLHLDPEQEASLKLLAFKNAIGWEEPAGATDAMRLLQYRLEEHFRLGGDMDGAFQILGSFIDQAKAGGTGSSSGPSTLKETSDMYTLVDRAIKNILTEEDRFTVEEYGKLENEDSIRRVLEAWNNQKAMFPEEYHPYFTAYLAAIGVPTFMLPALPEAAPESAPGFDFWGTVQDVTNWLRKQAAGSPAAQAAGKGNQYADMSDSDLADLALKGDRAAYDELVSRGLL